MSVPNGVQIPPADVKITIIYSNGTERVIRINSHMYFKNNKGYATFCDYVSQYHFDFYELRPNGKCYYTGSIIDNRHYDRGYFRISENPAVRWISGDLIAMYRRFGVK